MDRSQLGIVIPAYNEEATIAMVVNQVKDHGQVIVVNDHSSDRTAQNAQAAGAVVVTHPHNLGYDGALSSGFKRANELGCQYVITIDADGQHDASLISKYAALLEDSTDLVLGVRDRKQRVSEHVFAAYTSALYGISDPLCGMKGYRMDLYRKMGGFDSYGSVGTQLALYGAKNGFRLTQIKVPTRDRVGASRFGQALRGNYKILRAMALSMVKVSKEP